MKISAVIPVFNTDPKFIRESVDCVLGQSCKVHELIIVNDGSDRRETLDYFDEMRGLNDTKIIVVDKENGGIPSALNAGISRMTGDWFAGCSSDDRWLPRKIESQVQFVESNPSAKVLYCDWEFIDHNGFTIRTYREPTFRDRLSIGRHLIREYVGMWSGMMIHKSVFSIVGTYNEVFKIREDYEMAVRILTRYMMYHIPEILAQYRLHSGQITMSEDYGTRSDDSRRFCEMARDLAIENFGNEEDRIEFPVGRY